MTRTLWLASAVALPMALAAHGASAVAVTFSSNGQFATPTNCTASGPACTTANSGNQLILGNNRFLFWPTGPYSTLTAVDVPSTSTVTPQNNFKIGKSTGPTRRQRSTTSFNDLYTLTLTFTAPSNSTYAASVPLLITQPVTPRAITSAT